MRRQLRKGVGATLSLFELEGFSGDVSLTIFDETSEWRSEELLTPSAVATTLTAEAKHRARSLHVSSSVGFSRGMVAVVTPPSGIRFPINIVGVEGNIIHMETPLRAVLGIGTALTLNTVETDLTSTETEGLKRDLRMLWEYTSGLGSAVHISEYFDIVTDPWIPNITEVMLRREDSTASEYMGANVDLDSAVEGAHDEAENYLRSVGKYPDLYRFRNDLNRAVVLLTLSRLKFAAKNYEAAEIFQGKGEAVLSRVQGSKDWYDLHDDMSKGNIVGGTGDEYSGGMLAYEEQRSPINWTKVG